MLNIDLSKKYLLACSFGPDSMALFDMLYKAKVHFEVALVNYNLRKESTLEMASLIYYCDTKNIKYHVRSINTKMIKGNVEETCRKIRYSWFHELVSKNGFEAVLVAHHLDDLIETYLLQKTRKNLVKWYGIQEDSVIFGSKIIRPLLNFEKKKLEEYCAENNVPFMIDKSNLTNKYKRNMIRHTIVEKMTLDEKHILLKEIESKNKDITNIQAHLSNISLSSCNDLLGLSMVELQYALNQMVTSLTPSISVSKSFTKEIIKILQSEKSVVKMPIKNNVIAVKDYDGFHFELESEERYSYVMEKPSFLDTPYFYANFVNSFEGRNLTLDDFPITIRNSNPNDEIKIKDYKRKVKKLFVDWKMPISLRKTWPLIVNKDGIVIYMPRYQKDFKHNSNLNFWVK